MIIGGQSKLRGPIKACTKKAKWVYWLRHTGISDDVKRRPREHVRDDAGHGSGAITDKYIDIELRERHRSAKRKPILSKQDLGKF
ncbi:MAG: hypothetical protein BGO77_02800 [Caedibacter sp. 37-49]|nr:MAG: hypothetical protein BGO77_02800 [Caedibacter sp. 37-49]